MVQKRANIFCVAKATLEDEGFRILWCANSHDTSCRCYGSCVHGTGSAFWSWHEGHAVQEAGDSRQDAHSCKTGHGEDRKRTGQSAWLLAADQKCLQCCKAGAFAFQIRRMSCHGQECQIYHIFFSKRTLAANCAMHSLKLEGICWIEEQLNHIESLQS